MRHGKYCTQTRISSYETSRMKMNVSKIEINRLKVKKLGLLHELE